MESGRWALSDNGWRADTGSAISLSMIELTKLRETVEQQIRDYAPTNPANALGSELPVGWFQQELSRMKQCLVQPYLVTMRDLDADGALTVVEVIAVADDGEGSLVLYDKSADQFVLAVHDADPDRKRGADTVSCGVRGDSVDCFLAR